MYWIGLLPIVFWLAFSLFTTFFSGRYTSNQSRISQIFLLFGLSVFIAAWIDTTFSLVHGVMMLPVIAFFITHFVLLIKRRIWIFISAWILVVPAIIYPYFYEREISNQLTQKQIIRNIPLAGERLVIFSSELDLYQQHFAAGPVIDEELSKQFLIQTNDYRNAMIIYQAITIGKPRMIIDHWELMPQLKMRFPALEDDYRAGVNNQYYRKTNN
jgi:hypothetical protein